MPPQQVQLQADIGTLGIHGLGAFSSILATISKDDVAPTAMVQMENLGTCFMISGPFATKTPMLLQRFKTQRIESIAISIGWRKGDSASLMGDTAGGQAAALLSAACANIFTRDDCGEIISRLCSRLLPSEFTAASVVQLADVSNMLAQKLLPLGFGNFLAEQVLKIHRVYESLDLRPPDDLLDLLTVDSAIDLLDSLSQALRDDKTIVRISGFHAVGHILGLVLFMFPRDTVVTVEDIVVHEGERRSILIELHKDGPSPSTITLEKVVNNGGSLLSFEIDNQEGPFLGTRYHFTWTGWLARSLQLSFLGTGTVCAQEVLVAFCNLLVAILNTGGLERNSCYRSNGIPYGRLSALLEPYSSLRAEETCQRVLQTVPSVHNQDLRTVFTDFVQLVEQSFRDVPFCSCSECDFTKGWIATPRQAERGCRAYQLWIRIGAALNAGLACFFINAHADAAFEPDFRSYGNKAQKIITRVLSRRSCSISTQDMYWSVMELTGTANSSALASSYGATIFPTVLQGLHATSTPMATFDLLDGRIMFEDRYYRTLLSGSTKARPKAKESIVPVRSSIEPSSSGEHRDLLVTIRETAAFLEVRTTARCSGADVHLNLLKIIQASFSIARTTACSHPSTDAIEAGDIDVILTGVAAPCAADEKFIAVAMTQSNPVAQFLCCEPGARILRMQECCLGCALKQAKSGDFNVVLVS